MRTVALYTDSQGFGGAEVQLISLAERLDRRRFRPVVFHSSAHTPSSPLPRLLRKLDIESEAAPTPLDTRHVGSVLRFASMLRKHKVDIFHAHKSYPPACRFGLLAAMLARCEVILSTDQLRSPKLPPRRQQHLLRLLSVGMSGHIAVSASLKQYLVKRLRFSADKVRVIANWVDPDLFAGTSNPSAVRTQLAIPGDAPVVGCVARFHEQKGHLHLVTAAASLVRRHPRLRFVLVGDGATRRTVEARVRHLNLDRHFHFLGQREDVPALLTAIDIVALPSYYEGLPVSVLEAMSSGKPVVATAVDGTPEAIADHHTGLLVPPGDNTALADALEFLIGRPDVRTSMGAAGRRRVLEHFAAGPLVRQTEGLYEGGRQWRAS